MRRHGNADAITKPQVRYQGRVGGANNATASRVTAMRSTASRPPCRACHHCHTITPIRATHASPRATVTNGETGTSTTRFTSVWNTSPIPVGKFNQFAMICGACRPVTQPRLTDPREIQVPRTNTAPKMPSDGVTVRTNRRNRLSDPSR